MGNKSGTAETINILKRRSWFNLKNQLFEEDPNSWYNLQTNRQIKNISKNQTVSYSLRNIRILGSIEQIVIFWKYNIEQLSEIYPKGTEFQQMLFQPFSDIKFITEEVSNKSKNYFIGNILSVQTTDIEKLNSEEINSITPFNFGGLFVKCLVTKVVDGDTINVTFYIKIFDLAGSRSIGHKGEEKVTILPHKSLDKNSGFFVSDTIRMYGYDAQEKNTKEGQLAKQLLEEKISSLGNIIWCQLVETNIARDKYGRSIAILYEDKHKKKPLNDYLLKEEKRLKVRMVNPYLGGTKQNFDN